MRMFVQLYGEIRTIVLICQEFGSVGKFRIAKGASGSPAPSDIVRGIEDESDGRRRAASSLKKPAYGRGNRHRAVAAAFDIDVHKVPGRAGQGIFIAIKGDLIAHAGVAQLGHAYASVDRIRERDRAEIGAPAVDHKAHNRTVVDIKRAPFNLELVHGGVEKTVVLHVTHVSGLTHQFGKSTG